MKQFYSCLLAAVLSLVFSQKLHAQTVIDTNLTAFKNIFLSNLGQQTLVLNTNSYNPPNDSVFFSQRLFTCDDKGDSVTIFITITDTSVTPKNTYFTGSTIIWTIDNTPPVMIVNQSPTVYIAANGIAKLNFANINQGSWDSCGISLNTFAILTKTNYFCNEIGTQTVLARIADFNGNIASKSLQVTVADTTRPNLKLKPDTLYLGGNPLSAQLTFAKINNNSTDNCGLSTATLNGQTTLTFGCANVGANTITVALNDVNGNTATKTVQVWVLDTLGFSYTKNPKTTYLAGNNASVIGKQLVTLNLNGCSVPALTWQTDTTFSCANAASNPNYLTFTLTSGASSLTDSVAVTVLDTTSPTLLLKTDTFYMSTGGVSIPFAAINNGSFDNCALDSATVNGASQAMFSCVATGLQTLNVALFDIHGNAKTGSIAVYVVDTLTPKYTANNFTAYLNGPTVAVSRANILSGLSGGCTGMPTLTFTRDTVFSCADISTNPNYLTFTLAAGTVSVTDSVAITVLDTLPPTLILKSDTVFLSGSPLAANVNFALINNGSADACGLDSATVNGVSQVTFGCADVGPQTISVQLFDVNGNAASGSISVFVADGIQPSYTANPVTAYLNPAQTTISRSNFLSNVAGGCTAPIVSVLSDTVFTCANIQSNPNYIVFSVASGINTITDSVAVTVLDTIKPTLALQTDTLVLTSSGYTLTFADVNNGSADNCALDSTLLNGASQIMFGCTDTGWHKIHVVLYDANSNSATDSVLVYVIDTLQPGYTKIPYTAYLSAGGVATVSRNNILSNVTGGCGSSLSLTLLSDTTFTCSDISLNPHYIRFSVTTTGFSVLDSVPVLVLDTLKPTLMLQNITLNLSGNPLQATVQFSAIDMGTVDNCGIDSISMNGQNTLTFSCADTGSNAIIVVVIDQNGNLATDTIFALVQDTIGPSYQKSNYTAYLQSNSVTVPFSTLITNVAAGCYAPEVIALSDSIYTCAAIATNPNYLKFSISAAGTMVIDSIAITVIDTLKPNIAIPAADTLFMLNTNITLSFADFDLGTTDNCGIATSTLNGNNQITFTCSDIGLHKIMVLVTDVNGNSRLDSVMLFVDDTISPTYTKTPYTAFINAAGAASVATSNILTNVSAGCSTATSVITLLSDTTFTCADVRPLPNYIQFSATAGSITLFDSVAVFVVDTLPPTFTTKPPQSLHLGANGTRTLTQADLLVLPPADNCGIDSLVFIPNQLTCNNTSSFLPVAILAWDVNGNQTTKFMFVIAVDTIKPVLSVQSASVALDSVLGTYTLTAQNLVAVYSDNCTISNLTITPNQLSCTDTGLVTVTVSAFDPSGNVRVRTTTVSVTDFIAPAVTMAPSFTKYLDANGQATITPSDVQLTAPFDGCGIAYQQLSQTLFGCADVGPKSLALQVVDNTGNATVKNITVFIADTIKPIGITQNAVLSLDSTGEATLLISDVLVSASDVCGINNNLTTLSKTKFDCSDVGINMVTISIQDVNGNIRQYMVQVEVLGVSAGSFNVLGPTQVCGNQFNVRYSIDTVATANDYTWIITNGTVVSRSFKGREVFVHWDKLIGNGNIKVFEATTNGCKLDTAELSVSISGLAPDTTTIRFWNEVSQTTLVVSNTKANYYQWGYDVWSNGIRVSTPLAGETQTSYYNPAIGSNIQTLGYHYWCELSMDSNCWNRSYFQSYPINVPENELSNLHVYPNPFTNTLRIMADSPMQHIKLYDLYGKLLRNQTLDGLETIELNELQELPAATYLLQIEFNNGTHTTLKVIRLQ